MVPKEHPIVIEAPHPSILDATVAPYGPVKCVLYNLVFCFGMLLGNKLANNSLTGSQTATV